VVIFDLEWNSGLYDGIRLDEILQIGAVKCSRPGGQVQDSFCAYIRPRVHRRYSPAAQALPELAQAQASQLDFKTAAERFFTWCGEDRVFGAWGGGDLLALRQNLDFWHLNAPVPAAYTDLQAAFGAFVGATASVSLEWAVDYCRVPDIFDPHNALSDAIYAWAVCAHIPVRLLDQAVRFPPVPGLRHPTAVLPRRKTPWHGPFESVEAMLNNRGCRRAVCPLCGQRMLVTQWACRKGGPYYAVFSCTVHGSHLWKLEAARDSKARLWANGTALPWTPGTRAQFRAAKRGGCVVCRGKRPRHRRRGGQ